MKRIVIAFLAVWSMLLTAAAADGSVTTVEVAHAPADAIFVAGAKDLYPLEFYDDGSEGYQGVLTQCLEKAAQLTGLDFVYLRGGQQDQRERMAVNKQVDIVSGLTPEQVQELGLSPSTFTLRMKDEGEELVYCLGYTDLMDWSTRNRIDTALAQITPEEIATFTLSVARAGSNAAYPDWMVWLGFGLSAVLLLTLGVVLSTRKKDEKKDDGPVLVDSTTGIGNWRFFIDMYRNVSPQARPIYVTAYFGFDGSRVQDLGGEQSLDDTLVFAAKELTRTAQDTDIVARVGYGFLVAHVCVGQERVVEWARNLLGLLGSAENPSNALFRAGIYNLSLDSDDCETILFNARQAYQRASRENREYLFSTEQLIRNETQRSQVVSQFQSALENREIKLYAQLTVDAKERRVTGGETLSRWDHPQRGLLHPASFVDHLTEDGSIYLLDLYVFEEVCSWLAKWKRQGINCYLSCNFTHLTLELPDLPERLDKILGQYDFDHGQLTVEITEDLRDTRESADRITLRNLRFLKGKGFEIALDDVGSGFSSFHDLLEYPIDVFKLDRSILKGACAQERGERLMQGMCVLAHRLQMEVLCEGVETEEQASMAVSAGCDHLQGFLFYRPIPIDEATKIIQKQLAAAEA